MNGIRQLISDVTAALGRLSERERRLVALAGGALLVFIIAIFTLTVTRSITSRESRIQSKQKQLEEVAKLTVGFKAQETIRNELERRLAGNKGMKLFSYLEDLAKKDSVSIGGMNDKGAQPLEGTKINESSVEVTFTRIPLDKLVKYLTDVEAQGLVKVTRLQVRPRTDEPVLDAWLIVTTYTLES